MTDPDTGNESPPNDPYKEPKRPQLPRSSEKNSMTDDQQKDEK
jgi:hypothetical protein